MIIDAEVKQLIEQICELFEMPSTVPLDNSRYLDKDKCIQLLKAWRHELIVGLLGGRGFSFSDSESLRQEFAWADDYLKEHPELLKDGECTP